MHFIPINVSQVSSILDLVVKKSLGVESDALCFDFQIDGTKEREVSLKEGVSVLIKLGENGVDMNYFLQVEESDVIIIRAIEMCEKVGIIDFDTISGSLKRVSDNLDATYKSLEDSNKKIGDFLDNKKE